MADAAVPFDKGELTVGNLTLPGSPHQLLSGIYDMSHPPRRLRLPPGELASVGINGQLSLIG